MVTDVDVSDMIEITGDSKPKIMVLNSYIVFNKQCRKLNGVYFIVGLNLG